MISTRRLRKEKKIRYIEVELKKSQAEQIKKLFGKPNPNVRSQLFKIMKDKPDYQKQLKMMKKMFK